MVNKKGIELLEKCREEIQNYYGRDTEKAIEIVNYGAIENEPASAATDTSSGT